MKTLYHGNRHKTTEMVQEEIYALGSQIRILGEYSRAKDPIECACEVCGYTWVGTVNSLLNGQGCNKCAGRINPTLKEFQNELDLLGKTYTVSGNFVKSTDKLTATCSVCGYSWEAISGSLRKVSYNCQQCRAASYKRSEEKLKRNWLDKDNFSKKFEELRSETFTLLSEFIDSKTKIHIVCKTCNSEWSKYPDNILSCGCAKCSGKVKGSLEKVQQALDNSERNIEVSGKYTNAFVKLNCKCLVCDNEWDAHPHNLINGLRGCPSCALTGYDPNKPGYLYYLRVSGPDSTYWKIGITNIGLKGRFKPSDRKLIEVLYYHLFDDGYSAQKAERNILNMFKEYRAEGVKLLKAGNTELFTKDVLQMNHLIPWGI